MVACMNSYWGRRHTCGAPYGGGIRRHKHRCMSREQSHWHWLETASIELERVSGSALRAAAGGTHDHELASSRRHCSRALVLATAASILRHGARFSVARTFSPSSRVASSSGRRQHGAPMCCRAECSSGRNPPGARIVVGRPNTRRGLRLSDATFLHCNRQREGAVDTSERSAEHAFRHRRPPFAASPSRRDS